MKILSKKQKLYYPDRSELKDQFASDVLLDSQQKYHYPDGLMLPDQAKKNALFRMADSLIIIASFWLACVIFEVEWTGQFSGVTLIGVLFYQVIAEFNEVYIDGYGSSLGKESLNLFKTWFFTSLILGGIYYPEITAGSSLSDSIVLWLLWTPLALMILHSFVRFVLSAVTNKRYQKSDVAVVGATELGQRLERVFKERPGYGLRFLGYYDDRIQDRPTRLLNNEIQLLGDLKALVKDVKKGKIRVLYIVLPIGAGERIRKLVEKLSDSIVSIYLVPNLFGFDPLRSRWSTVSGVPAVSIYDSPFYGLDAWIKRTTDIVLGILILIVIAIPMAVIAMAVKFSSPGPIIFQQWRYGIYGESFKVYKFRTMKVSDDDVEVPQAIKNDPRLERFGALLRRTSLDELPQFINVLRGEMSIVGPRPHAVPHNEFYRRKINGYMLRHKVKPGITGLAQINGYRGETKTIDKMVGRVKYDLDYIQNWSLGMDLKIIFQTVYKVAVGKNAH